MLGNDLSYIKTRADKWASTTQLWFDELKENEETLNAIYVDVYGLNNEISRSVPDRDISIRLSNLSTDIRSLISYAVGCMFGRYSLDVDGLAYAGGEWDESRYKTFLPDEDNCIPVTDEE